MTDVNNKTFGLSKDNKRKAMILCLAMTALGLFVAYMDGDPVGILFFLPISGIILAIIFRTQLIISNEYIRTTDGLFKFHSSWDNIEKVMANGLLTKHPVLSYRKWATPYCLAVGLA